MSRTPLNATLSLYLDLSRISAAMLVLLHHVFQPPFHSGVVHFPGRSAVIVFFVISGFVVAYSAQGLTDWRVYVCARAARIYSVALPALALTAVLYVLGVKLWPQDTRVLDQPLTRLLVSALFLNQFWNLTVDALNNGPYWSLCYEVWYYVLFGIACFMRGWSRWAALALVALIVGPRILLLMPIWLMGWALFRTMPWTAPKSRDVLLFWAFTLTLAAVMFWFNPADALSDAVRRQLEDGYWRYGTVSLFIGGDWRFPSDYLLGLLFTGSLRYSSVAFRPGFDRTWIARRIRASAQYTFSLYLYHVPILIFLHPALVRSIDRHLVPWMTSVAIFVAVVALGKYTEQRKQPYLVASRKFLSIFPVAAVRSR